MRILPEMCARTSCPLGSSTLKRAFGRLSFTLASSRMFSSLAMSEPLSILLRFAVADAAEATVLVGEEVGADLLHDVERDADHDQQAGAAHQHASTASAEAEVGLEDLRQDGDDREEHRADEGDALEVEGEVVDG